MFEAPFEMRTNAKVEKGEKKIRQAVTNKQNRKMERTLREKRNDTETIERSKLEKCQWAPQAAGLKRFSRASADRWMVKRA